VLTKRNAASGNEIARAEEGVQSNAAVVGIVIFMNPILFFDRSFPFLAHRKKFPNLRSFNYRSISTQIRSNASLHDLQLFFCGANST